MENFVIAIPSYQRADKQDTIKYLSRLGVPKDKIYIFVQTQNDYETYQKYAGAANIVCVKANTVSEARNNILRHFDCNILMLDDDIRRLGTLKNGALIPTNDRAIFAENINRCFEYTKANKGKLFGVYPVYNDYFMSATISTKTSVNTVMGFVGKFDMEFDEGFVAKEDLELCGRILHRGGRVFRYNHIAVDAKHRTNDGGCKENWHNGENEKAARRLCIMYPEIYARQKNPQEVRMAIKDVKKPHHFTARGRH